MGGLVLAAVTNLGGIAPTLLWSIFAMLTAYRLLMPGYNVRKIENKRVMENKQTRTRKAVNMLKSIARELAKAAPITVLFHTVGIDALSL